MVKSVRFQCIELLTEIEARLDFDDEMPPLDINQVVNKIHSMSQDVESALETANYDQLLQSGLQVQFLTFFFTSSIPRKKLISFTSLLTSYEQLCCLYIWVSK